MACQWTRMSRQRRINVDATSLRCIDVDATITLATMPRDFMQNVMIFTMDYIIAAKTT